MNVNSATNVHLHGNTVITGSTDVDTRGCAYGVVRVGSLLTANVTLFLDADAARNLARVTADIAETLEAAAWSQPSRGDL